MKVIQLSNSQSGASLSLWNVAAALSVTTEQAEHRAELGRHAKPRRQFDPKVPIGVGVSFFVLVGILMWLSGEAKVTGTFVILVGALSTMGMGLVLAGVAAWLSGAAFHSVSRLGRRLSPIVFWVSIIVASLLASMQSGAGFGALLRPAATWGSSMIAFTVPMPLLAAAVLCIATMLTPQFVATSVKPRLHQIRAVQAAWMFVLMSGIWVWAASVVSFVLKGGDLSQSSIDVIVLVCSVGVGLFGAVIAWNRRNLERLERRRMEVLRSLGSVLDAMDSSGIDSMDTTKSVRELRRVLGASPMLAPSVTLLPSAADYAVVETVELIHWAMAPTEDVKFPQSIQLRFNSGRKIEKVLDDLRGLSKSQVKLLARDFILRCHERLKQGNDPFLNDDPIEVGRVS